MLSGCTKQHFQKMEINQKQFTLCNRLLASSPYAVPAVHALLVQIAWLNLNCALTTLTHRIGASVIAHTVRASLGTRTRFGANLRGTGGHPETEQKRSAKNSKLWRHQRSEMVFKLQQFIREVQKYRKVVAIKINEQKSIALMGPYQKLLDVQKLFLKPVCFGRFSKRTFYYL